MLVIVKILIGILVVGVAVIYGKSCGGSGKILCNGSMGGYATYSNNSSMKASVSGGSGGGCFVVLTKDSSERCSCW